MTFDLCSIGVVRLLCCSPASYIIDIVRCPSFAINTIPGHTPTHAHTPRFMVISFLLVSWTAFDMSLSSWLFVTLPAPLPPFFLLFFLIFSHIRSVFVPHPTAATMHVNQQAFRASACTSGCCTGQTLLVVTAHLLGSSHNAASYQQQEIFR